ncbi:MAG: hypothetical protein WB988_14455 [Candidatus Nitrosopolaris sp.]|jgi:hypothetical protein
MPEGTLEDEKHGILSDVQSLLQQVQVIIDVIHISYCRFKNMFLSKGANNIQEKHS